MWLLETEPPFVVAYTIHSGGHLEYMKMDMVRPIHIHFHSFHCYAVFVELTDQS